MYNIKDKIYKGNLKLKFRWKFFDLNNNYLTGLLEGDGTISVPKTQRCVKTNRILYPTIKILKII